MNDCQVFTVMFLVVHEETQCHIHFPDSNRLPHGGEKSDQVSITGPVAAAEQARKKIRVRQVHVTLALT